MIIKLIGKSHRQGISKTSNKQYDFYELHIAVPAQGVVGEAAETKTIDAGFCDFDKLVLGVYDADFDTRGRLLSLKPVQPPAGK